MTKNVETDSLNPSVQQTTKGYELDFDDNTKFNVKIGISKYRQLKIVVSEKPKYNNIFEAKFTYDQLLEIDRFFAVFETMEDVVDEIDNLFMRNRVGISLDVNDNVILNLKITINNKPRIIKLKLVRRGFEQTEALNKLCKLVSAQTQKLDNLQKENDELKNEVGKLHNKIGKFKKKVEEEEEDEDDSENEFSGDIPPKKKHKKKKKVEESENESEDENENESENEKKSEESIKEFDAKEFIANSRIIKERQEIDFIIDKIQSFYKSTPKSFLNFKLLYSATEDGDSCEVFHILCDGESPLLVLIKTNKAKKFGGYTEASFEPSLKKKGKKDDHAFIFSIDKLKTYDIEKGTKAICCYNIYGPVFYGYEYCNIYLVGNFLETVGNVARKGDRFNTTVDFEINGGDQKFKVRELEVYKVYFREG